MGEEESFQEHGEFKNSFVTPTIDASLEVGGRTAFLEHYVGLVL